MIGAIAGDIIGSIYENNNIKTKEFPTIACMTGGIAQAFYDGIPDAIAQTVFNKIDEPLRSVVETFANKYPTML